MHLPTDVCANCCHGRCPMTGITRRRWRCCYPMKRWPRHAWRPGAGLTPHETPLRALPGIPARTRWQLCDYVVTRTA